MNYAEEVKMAAYGQWIELLIEVGGIHRDLLDGKHHQCPKCGGKDRFRLIDENDGAVLCNQCFNQRNGDGISAIQWMRDCKFPQALDLVADRVGVKKRGRRKKTPEDVLRFVDWRDDAATWCESKGISRETVIAEGGRMATYKGNLGVIAIPIHSSAETDPRGFAIFNRRGGTVPTKLGPRKTKVAEGSKAGWMGLSSLKRLESAVVIWKVEGVTDMLALADAIPVEERARHAVVTNAFGSTENPKKSLLEIFKGKIAAVIHDPDDAGEKGAQKWASAIAEIAEETRTIRLPDGKDLRAWLQSGGDFAQLKAIARGSPVADRPERETASTTTTDAETSDDVEEEDDDHIRLAKLFIKQRARRFLIQGGGPHTWKSNSWKRALSLDDLKSTVLRFIVQEFDRLAIEETELAKAKDEDPPKRKRINAQILGSVMTMIRSLGSIPSDVPYGSMLIRDEDGVVVDWEQRNMISFENGLLDLEELMKNGPKNAMQDHTPDWWSLVHLPYSFDPTARIGPYWTSFLEKNLAGDEKLIESLQEWMGYCLTPNTDFHKFLLMIGEGSNGKSVFCAVLEALLGEQNVSHVPLELFGQRFALTTTLGKLANIATETHDLDRVAEGYLKQFTDGSKMMFDRKGLPAIEARPTAKLVIATNQPPRFTDKSMGLWRRMLVAPFTVEIKEHERELGLDKPDWWLRREELPGIFNWAVNGLQRLRIQTAFTVPQAAEARKEEYRQDINPAREYLLSSFVPREGSHAVSTEVYDGYRKWCEQNGYKPMGSRTFGREVKRAFPGVERKKVSDSTLGASYGPRRWCYAGIRAIIAGDIEEEQEVA